MIIGLLIISNMLVNDEYFNSVSRQNLHKLRECDWGDRGPGGGAPGREAWGVCLLQRPDRGQGHRRDGPPQRHQRPRGQGAPGLHKGVQGHT